MILMVLVIIAVLSVNIACETQIIDGLRCDNIIMIGGCILQFAILSYCCYYILISKVTVYDDYIKFQYPIRGSYRTVRGNILLSDISSVLIGDEKFLHQHLTESQVRNLNKFYKQFETGRYSSEIRFAVSHADEIVIALKSEKIMIINTKPFSRKGLHNLFCEMNNLNIHISMAGSQDP